MNFKNSFDPKIDEVFSRIKNLTNEILNYETTARKKGLTQVDFIKILITDLDSDRKLFLKQIIFHIEDQTMMISSEKHLDEISIKVRDSLEKDLLEKYSNKFIIIAGDFFKESFEVPLALYDEYQVRIELEKSRTEALLSLNTILIKSRDALQQKKLEETLNYQPSQETENHYKKLNDFSQKIQKECEQISLELEKIKKEPLEKKINIETDKTIKEEITLTPEPPEKLTCRISNFINEVDQTIGNLLSSINRDKEQAAINNSINAKELLLSGVNLHEECSNKKSFILEEEQQTPPVGKFHEDFLKSQENLFKKEIQSLAEPTLAAEIKFLKNKIEETKKIENVNDDFKAKLQKLVSKIESIATPEIVQILSLEKQLQVFNSAKKELEELTSDLERYKLQAPGRNSLLPYSQPIIVVRKEDKKEAKSDLKY